jgi:hypothetical protein
MDQRQQLRRIRYHPGLLEILHKKLDDRVGALPQDSRIVQESTFSSVTQWPLEAADEAELQHVCAFELVEHAAEMSSMLCFLQEETTSVSDMKFPLFVSTSHLPADIPDHEVRFRSDYHERFSSGSRPLETATVKALRCFGAASSFLK